MLISLNPSTLTLFTVLTPKQLLLATRNDAVRAARKREDDAFAVRIGSPENIEAITAFFEKRPADFRKKN